MTFMGEIRLLPLNRIPKGWLPCDGQSLATKDYPNLYALIGNLYGGDFFLFNLPDLRGRVVVGYTEYVPGHSGGYATHGLTVKEIPSHSHRIQAGSLANKDTPKGNYPSVGAVTTEPGVPYPLYAPSANTHAGAALVPVGELVPHDNMMPSTVLVYCISISGVRPTPQ